MKKLKMFYDGNDTIIAHDVQGAMQVWNDTYGDDYEADLYGDVSNWEERQGDKLIRVVFSEDDEIDSMGFPPESVITYDETGKVVSATAQQWIDHIGKPYFLCSKEWR